MQFERCNNCHRPYQVNVFDFHDMEWVTRSETMCPHCGYKESRKGDHIFIVHALAPDEEAAFDASHPPASCDEGILDRE